MKQYSQSMLEEIRNQALHLGDFDIEMIFVIV